jgi:hypothetical protein
MSERYASPQPAASDAAHGQNMTLIMGAFKRKVYRNPNKAGTGRGFGFEWQSSGRALEDARWFCHKQKLEGQTIWITLCRHEQAEP